MSGSTKFIASGGMLLVLVLAACRAVPTSASFDADLSPAAQRVLDAALERPLEIPTDSHLEVHRNRLYEILGGGEPPGTLRRGVDLLFEKAMIHLINLSGSVQDGYLRRVWSPEGITVDPRPGDLRPTGRTFDLAIDGPGFFRVRLRDGSVGYTRGGNLMPDASEGSLVTVQGLELDPPVILPSRFTEIFVNASGLVYGFDFATVVAVGQVRLVRFRNPSGLELLVNSVYGATQASGEPIEGTPGVDHGFGYLRQRYLEGSNADGKIELAEFNASLDLYRTLNSFVSAFKD